MYEHTKSVNAYYFGEIDLEADNDGTIAECRMHGFETPETQAGVDAETLAEQGRWMPNPVIDSSYGEQWSLRKVLRRFLWHDRIHAKAMYRMAVRTFPGTEIKDVFRFRS